MKFFKRELKRAENELNPRIRGELVFDPFRVTLLYILPIEAEGTTMQAGWMATLSLENNEDAVLCKVEGCNEDAEALSLLAEKTRDVWRRLTDLMS